MFSLVLAFMCLFKYKCKFTWYAWTIMKMLSTPTARTKNGTTSITTKEPVQIWKEIERSLGRYMCLGIPYFEHLSTGREQLIRSNSSAKFCFELSGNLN